MTSTVAPQGPAQGAPGPERTVVLSLGSNQGDSLATLQAAVTALAATPGIVPVALSGVYRTAPVGPVADQPDFLNLVLVARSTLEPLALLDRCHEVEDSHGRRRTVVGGPRTLDVDLVTVDGCTSDTPELMLPHPRAHERAFVLVPWLEAAPDAVLPGHGPVSDLVAGIDASGVVRTDDRVELS